MNIYTIQNPPALLKDGDQVIFELKGHKLTHTVFRDHLNNRDGRNDQIFDLLGLGAGALATAGYGYAPLAEGIWPYAKNYDYPALTRLVCAIYGIIANLPKEEPKSNLPITNGCYWFEGDSILSGVAIRCDRDGNPLAAECPAEPWERFKIGDHVKGKSFNTSNIYEGEICEFDKLGTNRSHWRVKIEGDSFPRWLSDEGLEFASKPEPKPKPVFQVKNPLRFLPIPVNVTEFYLEQSGACVNLRARRGGTDQILAAIVPEGLNGKGVMRRYHSARLDGLQIDNDGAGRVVLDA